MEAFEIFIGCGIGLYCVAMVTMGILSAKAIGRMNRIETRVEFQERRVKIAKELGESAVSMVNRFEKDFLDHEREQEDDLHRLTAGLQKLEVRVSGVEGELNDANEVMEAQARQEKALFDGINSIMDYDVTTARKAVNLDAEG